MNFEETDDQRQMIDATRKMVSSKIDPVLQKNAGAGPLSKNNLLLIFKTLAELGIAAPRLPAEAGGSGMKMLEYGLLYECLPPVIAISLLSHEGTLSRIYAGCPDELKERLLPDLIAGKRIACTANTEPEAGTDSRAIRTTLRKEGARHVINGRKMWITNASVCDLVNVSCVMRDAGGTARTVRVIVERDVSPFEVRETPMFGLRDGHLGEVLFDNVAVPEQNILTGGGDAPKFLTMTWNGNRPLLGLSAVHLATKALEAAKEYALERRAFGKPLAGHQSVQQHLAQIEADVISSRLMCLYALDCIDRGMRPNGTSAMAKRFAMMACERAISLALTLHGAMGYSEELGLTGLLRDVRMLQIPDGTNEILGLIQAREMTGLAAFR